MKPTAPGSSFSYICLAIYFSFAFLFRSIKPKTQKYFASFILFVIYYFNLLQFSPVSSPISGAVTRKRLTTPLTHWVANGCYVCAGVVYVVLLGSPTGSITFISYLREIPTAVVLHHPFPFGEIPT